MGKVSHKQPIHAFMFLCVKELDFPVRGYFLIVSLTPEKKHKSLTKLAGVLTVLTPFTYFHTHTNEITRRASRQTAVKRSHGKIFRGSAEGGKRNVS